jgi:hypothetical protein
MTFDSKEQAQPTDIANPLRNCLLYRADMLLLASVIIFSHSAAHRTLWPSIAGHSLLSQAMASSFTSFLDHTQRRVTVGRTALG